MSTFAFAALFMTAVGALAAQHSYWRGRFDVQVASHLSAWDELDGRLTESQHNETLVLNRALVAELVVDTLTEDLAQAHRDNTLLRTGILDAEREANEMAQVLALPIELSERRAAR